MLRALKIFAPNLSKAHAETIVSLSESTRVPLDQLVYIFTRFGFNAHAIERLRADFLGNSKKYHAAKSRKDRASFAQNAADLRIAITVLNGTAAGQGAGKINAAVSQLPVDKDSVEAISRIVRQRHARWFKNINYIARSY